jgi:hypothetical protein
MKGVERITYSKIVADNSGFVVLSSLICKKNEKVVQTCFSVTWH